MKHAPRRTEASSKKCRKLCRKIRSWKFHDPSGAPPATPIRACGRLASLRECAHSQCVVLGGRLRHMDRPSSPDAEDVPGLPRRVSPRDVRSPPRPRVLIVFRNPSDRSTVRQALQALAIEVLVAGAGREALALARSRCCDGLIVDVRLPDVDGLDLMQALHDEGCHLPWFAYAAAWSPDAARRAHHLGARHLLHTLQADQMVDWVRSALARPTPIAQGPDAHERAAVSAADAWARLVVAGAVAPHDLRTLRMWAHVAGVSRTVLRARCPACGRCGETRQRPGPRRACEVADVARRGSGFVARLRRRTTHRPHDVERVRAGRRELPGRRSPLIPGFPGRLAARHPGKVAYVQHMPRRVHG